MSLTGALGVQLRATVSSFGPLLLGKVLSLNDTQVSVLTMVFKYADDQQLPLLDLADLRAVLQWLSSEEGKPALAQYGGMSSATVGVLLRKMIELESQGAEKFFGEPEFDVRDMLQTTSDGRGVVTSLELADVQDKPMLWSTFMMWLLAELYQNLPEAGDLPKPKLVFFLDEAHLLFDEAPKAFRDQIEQVIRLIRSKGSRRLHGDPDAEGRARPTCWPSWATGSSTRCGPIRQTTTRRSRRRCAPSPRRRSTIWRRR